MQKQTTAFILLILITLSGAAFAQDGSGGKRGGQRGGHHGPPPEAVEACSGMQAGAACVFEGRGGEALEGTCFSPDEEHPLACRPANAPKHGGAHEE
jgi:hypothetical protein